MLPTKIDAHQQGDLGGQKIAMTLDQSSLVHLQSLLTDLYADPELAIVREYCSNSWDSHVAAGQSQPIEVFTPGPLSNTFTVKDYGTGLSKQDIVDIFSKYGASTKRATNDQTGMLGLGCKSALTYTNQFNIRAVKDGQLIHVVVSRDATGAGMMEIIAEKATDESNGVEIKIPTKSSNELEKKAVQFLKYWPKGRALLNGHAVDQPEYIEVTDDIWLIPNGNKAHVVMGGVAYPISGYYGSYGVVYFVPMGSVNFTPSREALHKTALTDQTIKDYHDKFKNNVLAAKNRDIDTAESHWEALARSINWRKMYLSNVHYVSTPFKYTYRNEAIPNNFVFTDSYSIGGRYSKTSTLGATDIMKSTIVDNFDVTLNSYNKTKIRRYAQENAVGDHFVFTDGKNADINKWLTGANRIDWSDIAKIKFKSGTKKAQPKHRVFDLAGWTINDVAQLDSTKTLLYGTEKEIKEYNDRFKLRTFFDSTYEVAVVSQAKTDKFTKSNPQAKHFKSEAERLAQEYLDKTSEGDILACTMGYYDKMMLKELDHTQLEDPELKRMAKLLEHQPANANGIGIMRQVLNKFEESSHLRKRYPLLNRGENKKHMTVYLNAAYNEFYKEPKNEV